MGLATYAFFALAGINGRAVLCAPISLREFFRLNVIEKFAEKTETKGVGKILESFEELRVSRNILSAVKEMGFTVPTPIQQQAIPLLMQGDDIIGQAQTGTGKTAAFAIPILESIDESPSVQALVLVPTRELAVQVAEEMRTLGKHSHGAKVLEVYGGVDIERQVMHLNHGVNIVIGTPGRLIDLIKRGSIKLSGVRIAVLDEADRMLDMGFIDDVEFILSHLPKERQTALFSATMPKPIIDLSHKFMVSPEFIKVSEDKLTVEGITQYYMGLDPRDRIDALCTLFKARAATLSIVFCRTKRGADNLETILRDRGFKALSLHGNLSQAQRDKVMQKFRAGEIDILVATDLAARGLDVEAVSHIINYNLPEESAQYVHRIGRTGRAGKSGEAISFATNLAEIRTMQQFASETNSSIQELKLEIIRGWKRGLMPPGQGERDRYRRGFHPGEGRPGRGPPRRGGGGQRPMGRPRARRPSGPPSEHAREGGDVHKPGRKSMGFTMPNNPRRFF